MTRHLSSLRLSIAAATLMLSTSLPLHAQPTVWHQVGVGGGGALYNPTFNPHNTQEMWVTCDMGEVFHTRDLGGVWETIPYSERTGNGVWGHTIYTGNPQVQYTIGPARVSTDGGTRWNTLAGDPIGGDIITLHADYDAPGRIVIADYGSVHFSGNGGAQFVEAYSTSDGNGVIVADVLFDGQQITVITSQGEIISTDGGATWNRVEANGIPAGEAIVSATVAGTGTSRTVYAVTFSSGDAYPGSILGHEPYQAIYRRSAAGVWQACGALPPNVNARYVAATRTSPDIVYAAGGSDESSPTIYKSVNGGTSWSNVFRTAGNENIATGWQGEQGDRQWSFGEYALGFGVAASDPNYVAVTDFGYVHTTSDGGTTWRGVYTDSRDLNPSGSATPKRRYYRSNGLENTAVWHLCWTGSSSIWAGCTDIRGIRSNDGGASWGFDYTGIASNTVYMVVRESNGTLYAPLSSIHDMYQSTYLQDSRINNGSGSIIRSNDNGATWETIYNAGHPVYWLALDPRDNARAIASVIHSTEGGLYLTENIRAGSGATWTRLATPPRTEGHPAQAQILNDGTIVAVYSGRRNPAGSFTESSGVYVSTDNGASWTDRSTAQMHYWTRDLVIDPHDATQSTWYVCVFSGWGGPPNGLGGLYRTTDRGVNWTRLSSIDRVASCAVNPRNRDQMYLSTESEGLWYSANATSSSPTFTQVAEYPFHFPFRIYYDPYDTAKVWVTSFGNGIRWGSTSTGSTSGVGSQKLIPVLTLHPQPADAQTVLSFGRTVATGGRIRLIDQSGRVVRDLPITPGTGSIRLDLRDVRPGRCVVEATLDGERVRTMLTVVK